MWRLVTRSLRYGLVRTPKNLHRKLAELSKREGVSLNTLAVSLLAEGVGEILHL
jgi:predicted HicB family RNase H-like nuclease